MAAFPSIDFRSVAEDKLEESIAQFSWLNPPQKYSIQQGKGLCVTPKGKTDFWRKIYEVPPADRSSGHALLHCMPSTVQSWKCTIEFALSPCVQYDQGGVMVYVDDKHWIKAGIEMECGSPQMSCVVTNEHSDWNYLPWRLPVTPPSVIKLSVFAQRYDTVCECKFEYENENGDWMFLRESPLVLPSHDASMVRVGPMCCAPKKELGGAEDGMECSFYSVHIEQIC